MREWLPDDHLVWVIVEALERSLVSGPTSASCSPACPNVSGRRRLT